MSSFPYGHSTDLMWFVWTLDSSSSYYLDLRFNSESTFDLITPYLKIDLLFFLIRHKILQGSIHSVSSYINSDIKRSILYSEIKNFISFLFLFFLGQYNVKTLPSFVVFLVFRLSGSPESFIYVNIFIRPLSFLIGLSLCLLFGITTRGKIGNIHTCDVKYNSRYFRLWK